ncbi:hypothetical protein AAHA92_06587 [Salvia divinorum]|uniref:Myb/SANT-like domain-containing protein n=1 Tax=Salvia divinorum TaxID=28513 RepID=A0ABD1I653_SALDI
MKGPTDQLERVKEKRKEEMKGPTDQPERVKQKRKEGRKGQLTNQKGQRPTDKPEGSKEEKEGRRGQLTNQKGSRKKNRNVKKKGPTDQPEKGRKKKRKPTAKEDYSEWKCLGKIVASCYLGKLEEAMGIQFPASRIKGTPHIVSRITAWKKTYNSLVGILQRSGVGFNNHGNFKIDCDDDQWDQIVKADKNTRFMRDKSWPQWEARKEVFGKDRANGSTSEVIMQAVNSLYSQEKQASTGEDEDNNLSFEDLSSNDPHLVDSPDSSVADRSHQTSKDTRGPTPTLKKITGDQAIDGLLNMLGKMHEDTNARLQCLTLRIGYEYDLSKVRKEVFEVLGRILELTLKQRYEAGDIILEKVQRLDFF